MPISFLAKLNKTWFFIYIELYHGKDNASYYQGDMTLKQKENLIMTYKRLLAGFIRTLNCNCILDHAIFYLLQITETGQNARTYKNGVHIGRRRDTNFYDRFHATTMSRSKHAIIIKNNQNWKVIMFWQRKQTW